jgi:hypothetical protein
VTNDLTGSLKSGRFDLVDRGRHHCSYRFCPTVHQSCLRELMPKFSRHLPSEVPARVPIAGRLILLALAAGFIALLYFSLAVRLIIVGLTLATVVWVPFDRRRLRRMASTRGGEDLCTFARSFPRGSVDPWVIRAVYQEFSPYYATGDIQVPIRAADRLAEDVRIDPEDVEEIAKSVAYRAGYSLADPRRNPFHGNLKTVGDFVRFLAHQPRLRAR